MSWMIKQLHTYLDINNISHTSTSIYHVSIQHFRIHMIALSEKRYLKLQIDRTILEMYLQSTLLIYDKV